MVNYKTLLYYELRMQAERAQEAITMQHLLSRRH